MKEMNITRNILLNILVLMAHCSKIVESTQSIYTYSVTLGQQLVSTKSQTHHLTQNKELDACEINRSMHQ